MSDEQADPTGPKLVLYKEKAGHKVHEFVIKDNKAMLELAKHWVNGKDELTVAERTLDRLEWFPEDEPTDEDGEWPSSKYHVFAAVSAGKETVSLITEWGNNGPILIVLGYLREEIIALLKAGPVKDYKMTRRTKKLSPAEAYLHTCIAWGGFLEGEAEQWPKSDPASHQEQRPPRRKATA